MSKKAKKAKGKNVDDANQIVDEGQIGNDYYAEAEGIKNGERATVIIVNINAGQPPVPPYKP